ncbi:MAG: hypothetical protein E3J64_08060, partial [Anaerolineales bacterium]
MPRWFALHMQAHEIAEFRTGRFISEFTKFDTWLTKDLFYQPHSEDDARPRCEEDVDGIGVGAAVYGDGYAITGYRARKKGGFSSIYDIRDALTYVERSDPPNGQPDLPEEQMELDAKFAAIRPYITTDSWVDTDQCGYGKFEHYEFRKDPQGRQLLIDRNRAWNVKRNYDPMQNKYMGELAGCYVAMLNGIGQGQIKRITGNTIDTIFLNDEIYPNSEMVVEPTYETSYVIIGKDFSDPEEQRLYVDKPLSFHRPPVNVNTATDKVLVALLMGLQTTWGPAGYPAYLEPKPLLASNPAKCNNFKTACGYYAGTMDYSVCPSVISLGRDTTHNAHLVFPYLCPSKQCDGGCFFCNFGRRPVGEPGKLNEAHMMAWQIMKEREQTILDDGKQDIPDGFGPFKGWDDLYFRVFRKFEVGDAHHVKGIWSPRGEGTRRQAMRSAIKLAGKRGIARLCMANFNSNTDILKFQPNLEWINRWGAN